MENYREMPENAVDKYHARLDETMNQIDILVENGYDMQKVGELIRLIDYIRSAIEGKQVAPPEPLPDIRDAHKQKINPENRVQIDMSANENFARVIYDIIPGIIKNNDFESAMRMLESFVGTAVKNTTDTKKVTRKPRYVGPAFKDTAGAPPLSSDMTTKDKMEAGHVFLNLKVPKIDK